MISISTRSAVYFAARTYFLAQDHSLETPNPSQELGQRFEQLLAQYSAKINSDKRNPLDIHVCDRLGLSPGVDTIDFHDDRLYTLFVLTCT